MFFCQNYETAKAMMLEADLELLYDGGKEMILVDDVVEKRVLKGTGRSYV